MIFKNNRERIASMRAHDAWQKAQEAESQAEAQRLAELAKAERLRAGIAAMVATKARKKKEAALVNGGTLPRYIARSL